LWKTPQKLGEEDESWNALRIWDFWKEALRELRGGGVELQSPGKISGLEKHLKKEYLKKERGLLSTSKGGRKNNGGRARIWKRKKKRALKWEGDGQ